MPGLIQAVPRLRSLRDSVRMARDPLRQFCLYEREYGDLFRFRFGGMREVIVCTRPSFLEQIFKGPESTFHKSYIQTERMQHFLGEGLLTSHGPTWRHKRRHIRDGFRSSRLAAMGDTLQSSLEEGLARFERAMARGVVQVAPEMTAITFAMVARGLFGVNVALEDTARISEAITQVQGFMVRQITQPYLAPWFRLSGMTAAHDRLRTENDARLLASLSFAARRADARGAEEETMLDTLLALTDEHGEPLGDALILAECMQILVAAHETSSNVLSWALYLLSRHPEALTRARAEACEAAGGGAITQAGLEQLPYLWAVLQESMRLYPAFWIVDRMVVSDTVVDGVPLRAGSNIIAFIYGTHRSPKLWSEPDRFRPERFLEGEGNGGFVYLPFGGGKRQCIGSGFAKLQMLMILTEFLRRYQFAPAGTAEVVPRPMLILRPSGGLPMHFQMIGR